MSNHFLPWNNGNQWTGSLNDAIAQPEARATNTQQLSREQAEELFPPPKELPPGTAIRCTQMADRIILAMEGFDGDQSPEFLDDVFSKLLPDVHDLLTLLAAAHAPAAPAPEASAAKPHETKEQQ